jgi:hypothetical protein
MKEDMTRRIGITDVATMAFNSIELPLDEQLQADLQKMFTDACGIPAKYLSTDDGASAATAVAVDLTRGLSSPILYMIKEDLEMSAEYKEMSRDYPINRRIKGELEQLPTEGIVVISGIGTVTSNNLGRGLTKPDIFLNPTDEAMYIASRLNEGITDLSSVMSLPVEDNDNFNLDHLDLGDIEPDSYQEQLDDGCDGGACKI